MNKKSIAIVGFLLVLFTAPMILAPYSNHPVKQEQPLLASGENWLNGWAHRKSINITGSTGASTDYQVKIDLNIVSGMQTDFDDVRFTESDGITQLDYWREKYTVSTSATFWVEVSANLDTNQTIYMYYENDAVSTTSNGTNTFLFYEDWTDEDFDQWTKWKDDAGGSETFSFLGAMHGNVLTLTAANGDFGEEFRTTVESSDPFALMFRAKIPETTASYQSLRVGSGCPQEVTLAYILRSTATTRTFAVIDDNSINTGQTMVAGDFGSYFTYEITRPRDGSNTSLFKNGAQIETAAMATDANEISYACFGANDAEYSLYSDWFAARKYQVSEPTFSSFGDEETYQAEWVDYPEAVFWFMVLMHPWGLNASLILLGMILVVLSGVYLVKGGRSEASMNKVYYALVMFMLGWGLVIGGILP